MATVQVSPLIFNKFKGIREQNGVNTGGEISAIECKNIELFNSEIGNEVGIKTIDGNSLIYSIDTNYNIVGIFKSEQKLTDSSTSFTTYFLIYAEHKTNNVGKLYYINSQDEAVEINTSFTKTGQCNGITMTSTAYDVFIFTNGVKAVSVSFAESPCPKVETITDGNGTPKKDYEGHDIVFLAMTSWNGFLVVATKYGIRASHQNDITTWNDNPEGAADSWYINYSKPVTALYAYTGGLFIFTGDTTDFINASPNISGVRLQNTAGVGCMNYQSIVKHDTYLFFYDNNQKNIYYIQNIDNGQTRPAGPVAKEIQSRFKRIETFKMYSCIYNTRNEIWCLINDKILIFDYFQQEWLERVHQPLTSVVMTNNIVYCSSGNTVLSENVGTVFNDAYYPSKYETIYINAGSNTNLKKQKTPLLMVLNGNYTNDFYVQLIINGKEKSEKHIQKTTAKAGFYYIDDGSGVVPDTMKYGSAKYSLNSPYSKTVVEISTPQTWYTLAVRVFTREPGQGFCINSMELKNMKAKLKTKGR